MIDYLIDNVGNWVVANVLDIFKYFRLLVSLVTIPSDAICIHVYLVMQYVYMYT